MTAPGPETITCSDQSAAAGEQLFATASRYGVYVLVEHNDPWPNKAAAAFVDATFRGDDAVRWQAKMDALPNARLQLIHQRGFSSDVDGISVYVAVLDAHHSRLYATHLLAHRELLDLDIAGMVRGDGAHAASLTEEPLYAVCTNGRHDACCARLGMGLYREMAFYVGRPIVWQTTHTGGHRFAGNLLCFPHGILYGRVERHDVPPLVDAYQDGRLYLPAYRGRTCYEPVEQAAEYYLAQKTGETKLDAFTHVDTIEAGDGFTVRFRYHEDERLHQVRVKRAMSDWKTISSCGDTEAEARPQFSLDGYAVVED